jgi:hypothetical protein
MDPTDSCSPINLASNPRAVPNLRVFRPVQLHNSADEVTGGHDDRDGR